MLLAISIVIAAGIYLMVNRAGSNAIAQTEQEKSTRTSLALVDRALAAYAINNKRLPCPASPADASGVEANDGTLGNCTSPDGVVPWGTLHIRLDDALDAWGRRISYRVYSGATGFTQANGLDATPCNTNAAMPAPTSPAGPNGECQVSASTVVADSKRHETSYADFLAGKGLSVNEFGTVKTGLAYLLISHGASGYGAFANASPPSSVRLTLPASSAELANISGTAGNTYQIMAITDSSVGASATAHFDDILVYRNLGDLLQETALKGFNWGFVSAAMAFNPGSVATPPANVTLTITLSNSGATQPSLFAPLVVSLNGGLTVAATPAIASSCSPGSAAVTATPGTTSISVLGNTVIPAANGATPGSCAISVKIAATASGTASIAAGNDSTAQGLLTKTIGWNRDGVTITLNVASGSPPATVDSAFNRSTVGAAAGTTITANDTGRSSIAFSAYTVSAFASSARDISTAASGGIGVIVPGSNNAASITTSGGEGLRFLFNADYRYLGLTLLGFDTTNSGSKQQMIASFYDDGGILVAQIVKQSCQTAPADANLTFNPGSNFRRVDIQALAETVQTNKSSSFLLGGITACATGTEAACVASGASSANDCP